MKLFSLPSTDPTDLKRINHWECPNHTSDKTDTQIIMSVSMKGEIKLQNCQIANTQWILTVFVDIFHNAKAFTVRIQNPLPLDNQVFIYPVNFTQTHTHTHRLCHWLFMCHMVSKLSLGARDPFPFLNLSDWPVCHLWKVITMNLEHRGVFVSL